MLDLTAIRSHFPALAADTIFLDNPGGTQVCQQTIDRLTEYYLERNANHGGAFPTSASSDASVDETRAAMADFLHAASLSFHQILDYLQFLLFLVEPVEKLSLTLSGAHFNKAP